MEEQNHTELETPAFDASTLELMLAELKKINESLGRKVTSNQRKIADYESQMKRPGIQPKNVEAIEKKLTAEYAILLVNTQLNHFVLSKMVEYGNKLLELYKEEKESLEENEAVD
jgi:hypothetical protein